MSNCAMQMLLSLSRVQSLSRPIHSHPWCLCFRIPHALVPCLDPGLQDHQPAGAAPPGARPTHCGAWLRDGPPQCRAGALWCPGCRTERAQSAGRLRVLQALQEWLMKFINTCLLNLPVATTWHCQSLLVLGLSCSSLCDFASHNKHCTLYCHGASL